MNSQAKITSLWAYAGNDYGDGADVSAGLATDADILWVDWYIDGTYEKTTICNNARWAYESFSQIPGSIKGEKHRIEAIVNFSDGGSIDTDSDTFRVFAPKIISGTKYPRGMADNKKGDGIYGSVELYGHYHDGQNIVMSGSAFARNKTKVDLNAYTSYRHAEFKDLDGDGLDEMVWSLEDPRPSKSLPKEGGTYSSSGSSMISYPVGGDIGPDQEIKLNAHVHMDVGGVVWHEEGGAWTHEFTAADNK